jgi:3'(2'), 5'-bisphosphate nucleotidase
MSFARELQEALAAAEAAAKFVAAEYETFVAIPDAPAHITTHADRGAQEIILKHLRAAFPDYGLCAEEATDSLKGAPANTDRLWVVDPIDGTKGFAIKNGEFSIMIGLTAGGESVVGVVWEPSTNRVTYASKGDGCFTRVGTDAPTRCRVTTVATLAEATITQSHAKPGKPKPVVVKLQPGKVIETYSAGIKLAQVARGVCDLYVNDYPEFHDWDVCAGHVLVTEAGGMVSEFNGGPVQYGRVGAKRKGGLVATNGALHPETLRKLG